MPTNSILEITGGQPLYGSVRIGGAKNASYKLMLAALLADTPSRLLNFSNISDVAAVASTIRSMGGEAKYVGERALLIDPRGLEPHDMSTDYAEQGRFSSMFIPIFLHRFGSATVPKPGGDKIGKRPLDRHLDGLKALGATVSETETALTAQADRLTGTTYRFTKNTHTGTETMIMAACRAQGQTILHNAAQEPEVDDLIQYLNQMGARITRDAHDPRTIRIDGVETLQGSVYQIMPDRNEAVSYACAAIATKGDVILENVRHQDLTSFLEALDAIGAGYELGNYGIRFFYHQPLTATHTTTTTHPGFMTDWQPLWATVLTQCQGTSSIHETVMLQRFQYVEPLQRMGATIRYVLPEVEDRDSTYNFNQEYDSPDLPHAIEIDGPNTLTATDIEVQDLRHGATLTIAALAASGTSRIIKGVAHIDRGYEDIVGRLTKLGAQITRIEQEG